MFSIMFALLLAQLSVGDSAYHLAVGEPRNLRGSSSGMRTESIGVWVFESLINVCGCYVQ